MQVTSVKRSDYTVIGTNKKDHYRQVHG